MPRHITATSFCSHPFVTRFALISFSFYPVILAISGSQLKGNGEISFRLGFKDIWMQQTRSRVIGSWTNMIYDWSLFNSLLTPATVNLVAWSSLHVLLLQSILYHSTPFHALTHALFSLPRVFFSSSITSRRPWSFSSPEPLGPLNRRRLSTRAEGLWGHRIRKS